MMRLQPRHAVWIVVVTLALIFVFLHSGLDFDYVIPKRISAADGHADRRSSYCLVVDHIPDPYRQPDTDAGDHGL